MDSTPTISAPLSTEPNFDEVVRARIAGPDRRVGGLPDPAQVAGLQPEGADRRRPGQAADQALGLGAVGGPLGA